MGEPSGYRFVARLDDSHVRRLWELFQQAWWSRGRTPEEVSRLLAGPSLCYGMVEQETGGLVAFARVVTDGVLKAWICDVIVAQELRGRGLGRALLERVTRDERLAGIAHMELYCSTQLVAFYEPFGFGPPTVPMRLLRRERATE